MYGHGNFEISWYICQFVSHRFVFIIKSIKNSLVFFSLNEIVLCN